MRKLFARWPQVSRSEAVEDAWRSRIADAYPDFQGLVRESIQRQSAQWSSRPKLIFGVLFDLGRQLLSDFVGRHECSVVVGNRSELE